MYAEGADFGCYHSSTDIWPYFGASYLYNGNLQLDGNVQSLTGQAGTFANGLNLTYLYRQNPDNYVDVLGAAGGTIVYKDQGARGRVVCYQNSTYRTICSGVIYSATQGANRAQLMAAYVTFLLPGHSVQQDIAAVAVESPVGEIGPGPVAVRATFRNNGATRAACRVFFSINSVPPYAAARDLAAGLPGTDTVIEFPAWTAVVGQFTARCSTWLAGDEVPANNVATAGFDVVPNHQSSGWISTNRLEPQQLPVEVKTGAWLGYGTAADRVFAAVGGKRSDFYACDPATVSWAAKPAWPDGREAKKPGKGACGTAVADYRFYALKGNNTAGFWRYDAGQDSWTQLADLPLGLTNKKVKGGGDIVYPGGDHVYCLKGYKNEFWRYSISADSWAALPAAPAVKYGNGSWLALSDSVIYCHEAQYHVFHAFDLRTMTWGPALSGMPFVGRSGRSKKSKDGGCATTWRGSIYALKGGNTQEFWQYDIAADSWVERDTMPQVAVGSYKKKRVKAGADLTTVAAPGQAPPVDFAALKGAGTAEFWFYRETMALAATGRAATPAATSGSLSSLVAGNRTPRRPGSSNPVLSVFDASGRLLRHWSLGTMSSSFPIDPRSLPPGVYLARLEDGARIEQHKFVIFR